MTIFLTSVSKVNPFHRTETAFNHQITLLAATQ